ncbi:uroporphyrin-III C/tetrapyrrole methyltransferase [Pandoraea thiooxydans]|uniref:Ribosomal RNA small subunit methyltransferase I n=1 Tax=Pandoraea thiooxydans TaxID=445709 RepID=A0A0G3EYB3_9BURK|nr:16S rRNA (cytidine(1402)-2'-O)-methyltransferase [Pandoraea thiooxydans]AKJ69766.1 16S rRNA (cytidine(1402)-2'-O)-methyltransferase [Pandoraea thiooxydans]APR97519.1 uroporphyrin-III C/tetrapyrrole methyltransferase [Pandoraea thiooxydans]
MSALLALADDQHYPSGALYVVATPIGNTADITLRALHVLGMVDAVAAEDTRNSAHLLARYGLEKTLLAAHEHNERSAAEKVIARLRAGERVAYISDAGTPGISDPGARLVEAVRSAGLEVVPLPGPSAAITAVSVAGAWVEGFTFIGFLPSKAAQRVAALQALAAQPQSLVFYEAPHRIVETVGALCQVLGAQRRILIARELTKRFESLHECALAQAVAWLEADANRQRGEFVLVVQGAPPAASDALSPEVERVLALALEALPTKGAAKLAAAITGASKNALYERALALKGER